jgi:hypothetical protein
MTAAQFLQANELEHKFLNRNLASISLDEVRELSELTQTPLGELVLSYGFGASVIYVDDLEAAIEEQCPGTVLGMVNFVA